MANRTLQLGWWEDYRNVASASVLEFWAEEAESKSISSFCPLFIPGLLQTEAYAQALLRPFIPMSAAFTVKEQVEAYMKRQWHIFERLNPVDYHAVIDEFVLIRSIGNKEVLYEQLQHLHKMIQTPNITLHISKCEVDDDRLLYFSGVCTLLEHTLWRENMTTGVVKEDNPIVLSSYQGYFRRIKRSALSPTESQCYLEECIAKFE